MDINKALKTITSDKNLFSKAAFIWGLFLISPLISMILSVLNIFTGIIFPYVGEDQALLVSMMTSFVIPIVIQSLLLPVSMYISGYKFRIVETGEIPEHNDTMKTFKYAFANLLASLSINLIFGLLILVITGIIALLIIQIIGGFNEATVIVVILLGIFLLFLLMIVFTVINILIVPSMMFLYLRTKSIRQMFNISLLQTELQSNWKNFLLLIVVNIVLNFILGIVSFIFCFLGPLITATIQMVTLIVNGILLSQIYSKGKTGL